MSVGRLLFKMAAAALIARAVGQEINKTVPEEGINESMYVDINGDKQWINIYSKNKNLPVLLYLHGGPGSSTSAYDYSFTRKWADVFTVVTWDQRHAGKSYHPENKDEVLTREVFMEDGKQMSEFIRQHLGVDKIALLGHSWGSVYGANLALAYPEYYSAFIGTGQLVDFPENERGFVEKAKEWAKDDDEGLHMVAIMEQKLSEDAMDMEYLAARNGLMKRYGYDLLRDGTDYNLYMSMFFNPNYSIKELIPNKDAWNSYKDWMAKTHISDFSLIGKYEYQMPYFNINGDNDYQTNYEQAQVYYDQVKAPYKHMYIMKNTTHGLLMSKSEEFSEIVHQIAKELA